MNISSKNFFEIFSLEESFQIDLTLLNQAYTKLQAQYHPDKFINADDKTRLQALQTASIINEAFETLKSPLKLASYLLTLHGTDPEENNQSHLGEDFLFAQMELRDKLEEIAANKSLTALEQLKNEVDKDKKSYLVEFEQFYKLGQYAEAKPVYSKLQFLYKLLSEIDTLEEKLLDY
ncbi:Fe-S protein assembly co-chaperone HscB [Gammaproteobacteria bacterium]|nr:Fe-S protein assembly co-chaperone HscB [Gammaproteobacteria bacterium]